MPINQAGIRGVRSGAGAATWQRTIARAVETVASNQGATVPRTSVSIPRLSLRLPAHAGEREIAAALANAIERETTRARRGNSR